MGNQRSTNAATIRMFNIFSTLDFRHRQARRQSWGTKVERKGRIYHAWDRTKNSLQMGQEPHRASIQELTASWVPFLLHAL